MLADPTDAFGRDRGRWLALATGAAAHLDGWFDGGVISAHQRRSPYSYRGPARRLQMTFDVLGKLAWSAGRLRRAAAGTSPAAAVDPFDDLDELVRFDDRAGVWTHRSHGLVVAVPFVGPTRSDYQPAPRNPGTFEVPVDRALVTWVPAVHRREQVACGGGVPVSLVPVADGVHARWEGFPQAGGLGADTAVAGRREATTTVRGRTLRIEEHLVLGDGTGDPGVTFVSVTVPEAEGRPLRVDWECEHPHATREVDVSGIAEWRSFWGELPRVHELEVPVPADGEVRYAYEVTPLWRVASESLHHHYHQSLYGPMAGRVEQHHFASHHMANPAGALARLGPVDLFHLHWPEWFTGPDVAAMARFLDLLDEADVRLVWTQHNLRPHREDEAFEELYGLVASRAHGVIHHSAWGRDRALAGYRYRDDATHVVIPHGNFANLLGAADPGARAAAEAELGLPPLPAGGLRIGVVGAPRRAKRTVELMEAFTEVDRDDLQLLVLSLAEGEAAPDDPRLVALPYEYVDRDVYNRRLAAIDVVALPFDPEGDMITTGVVADVIGWGMPAVASSWGYLTESLGAAALPLGDTVDEMADALESLTPEAVADAAVAVAGLAESTSWERVAAADRRALRGRRHREALSRGTLTPWPTPPRPCSTPSTSSRRRATPTTSPSRAGRSVAARAAVSTRPTSSSSTASSASRGPATPTTRRSCWASGATAAGPGAGCRRRTARRWSPRSPTPSATSPPAAAPPTRVRHPPSGARGRVRCRVGGARRTGASGVRRSRGCGGAAARSSPGASRASR